MATTYAIKVDGEQVATMTADFAQASSPLLLDGDSTPYQVADACHRRGEAAHMLLDWANRDSSLYPDFSGQSLEVEEIDAD